MALTQGELDRHQPTQLRCRGRAIGSAPITRFTQVRDLPAPFACQAQRDEHLAVNREEAGAGPATGARFMEGSSSGYDSAVLTRQGSRGPREFESPTFRRRLARPTVCRRRGVGVPASLSARRPRVRVPPVAHLDRSTSSPDERLKPRRSPARRRPWVSSSFWKDWTTGRPPRLESEDASDRGSSTLHPSAATCEASFALVDGPARRSLRRPSAPGPWSRRVSASALRLESAGGESP